MPRIPYPSESRQPAWFSPTARVNFCEQDYLVTSYIAEFVNTITNITYVIYAYYGTRRLRGDPNAAFLGLPYLGLATVGVFSALFHGTLTYWGQMSDDVSMLFATSFVVHRACSFGRSAACSRILALAIAAAFVGFAAYHCYTDEVMAHMVLFGCMIVAVAFKTRELIKFRVKDKALESKIGKLRILGAGCAAIGYFLWLIDRHFCDPLTRARRALGQPWGYLLELHGWWHILTAISAYVYMALVEVLTTERQTRGIAFAWPVEAYLGEETPQDKLH